MLASHYAGSDTIATGDDLRRLTAMRHQLHTLTTLNDSHLQDARRRADAALFELGSAERKRARIEGDRRVLESKAVARNLIAPT